MYVSDSGRVNVRDACHVLGDRRSTQRRMKKLPGDEEALRTDVTVGERGSAGTGIARIIEPAAYRGLVRCPTPQACGRVIWRPEGLKVPRRQPKRGRLWLNELGIRLRPLHKTCSRGGPTDFVSTRTHDGQRIRAEASDRARRVHAAVSGYQGRLEREWPRAHDVLEVLGPISSHRHGPPEHLRSDNAGQSSRPRDWCG